MRPSHLDHHLVAGCSIRHIHITCLFHVSNWTCKGLIKKKSKCTVNQFFSMMVSVNLGCLMYVSVYFNSTFCNLFLLYHQKRDMAAPVSVVFCVHFWTMGGRGEVLSFSIMILARKSILSISHIHSGTVCGMTHQSRYISLSSLCL